MEIKTVIIIITLLHSYALNKYLMACSSRYNALDKICLNKILIELIAHLHTFLLVSFVFKSVNYCSRTEHIHIMIECNWHVAFGHKRLCYRPEIFKKVNKTQSSYVKLRDYSNINGALSVVFKADARLCCWNKCLFQSPHITT